MSEEEQEVEQEVPDYKTKRLETLARAREIARQNRLDKSSEKKEEHNKLIAERKQARLKAQKDTKEKQTKPKPEPEPEPELEQELEEERPEPPKPPKKPPKPKAKVKQRIIVEESESESSSETEEIVIVKKKKEKKKPPERVVYRKPSNERYDYPGSPNQQQKPIAVKFSDFFSL